MKGDYVLGVNLDVGLVNLVSPVKLKAGSPHLPQFTDDIDQHTCGHTPTPWQVVAQSWAQGKWPIGACQLTELYNLESSVDPVELQGDNCFSLTLWDKAWVQ